MHKPITRRYSYRARCRQLRTTGKDAHHWLLVQARIDVRRARARLV